MSCCISAETWSGAFHGLEGLAHTLHIDLPHDHDILSHESSVDHLVSPISFRTIMSFITFFGITGSIATYYRASVTVSLLFSTAVGLAVSYVVYRFTALIASLSFSSAATDADYLQHYGRVEVPIPKGGMGRVSLVVSGQNANESARSVDGQEIPAGVRVQVVGREAGVITVKQV